MDVGPILLTILRPVVADIFIRWLESSPVAGISMDNLYAWRLLTISDKHSP
jgi:hypothetical protein